MNLSTAGCVFPTELLYRFTLRINQLRTFPFSQHLPQMLRNRSSNENLHWEVLAIRSVSAKRLVLIVDKTFVVAHE